MNGIEPVEPYMASVTHDILHRCDGKVRVWSAPKTCFEGAIVVGEIKFPVSVTVLEVQKDAERSQVLRARIRYGEGHEGWVPYIALTGKSQPGQVEGLVDRIDEGWPCAQATGVGLEGH